MSWVLDPDGSPTPIYMPDERDEEFLNDLDAGYIGYSRPQVKVTKMTPIERLRAIQGDWPDKDYMNDGSDSGMTVGDNG